LQVYLGSTSSNDFSFFGRAWRCMLRPRRLPQNVEDIANLKDAKRAGRDGAAGSSEHQAGYGPSSVIATTAYPPPISRRGPPSLLSSSQAMDKSPISPEGAAERHELEWTT